MVDEQPPTPDPRDPAEESPAIEDAHAPNGAGGQGVGEDDPQLLDGASRSLDREGSSSGDDPVTSVATDTDDTSDATVSDDDKDVAPEDDGEPRPANWDRETSARKLIVELNRIEAEVREILETCDTRRKRKLGGTRRWHELEEDLIAWRYGHKIDDTLRRRLHELVAQRHHLFNRLRFIASTRPTWNS